MTKKQLETVLKELRFRAEYYRERQGFEQEKNDNDGVLLSMGKEQAYWSAIRVLEKELKVK